MRRHALIWTCVAFLIHVPVCLAYEYALRCPEENERRLRARQICSNLHKNDITNYACLFDININKSKESCNQIADYATPGERYVISGVRTTSPCQSGRYQPFALWANVSSKCLFVKSLCEEEGQIKALQVHSLSDQSCRCDFGHGYHFISKPLDLCSCVPSVEDCSCYFDPKIQLTYEENGCIQKYPAISTSQSFEKTSIASNLGIVSMDVDSSQLIPKVVSLVTIVIIIIFITGLILFCNKQKKNTSLREITEENTSHREITEENTSHREITEENTSQRETTEENTSQREVTEENTSHPEITEENTSQREITEENTSQREITEINTSHREITEENTSHREITEENTSHREITEENTSHREITEENTSHREITEENTSHRKITEENTSHREITEENTSQREITEENTSQREITEKGILRQKTPEENKPRPEFTVAIDLGTTSSVYAYCTTTTPKTTDIILNKQWDSYCGGLRSYKTPTCILLDQNMHALFIGYEARKEYSDYFCDGEADNYFFVDRFKMELYRTGSEITEQLKINDVKGRKVSAMKVFSQMLIKLKDRIMQKDIQEGDHKVDIKWVLSIPAVWTDKAEHFMRTCAGEAGISDDKLNIVVESESASVYIHYLLKENLLKSSIQGLPQCYLVIDLGGGTDDITAHTITSSGKLERICEPSGGNNGGKKVDAELWSRFENLLGKQVMDALKQEGSYMEFVEEVENMNNLISAETKNAKLNCKFPLHLLNKLCLKYHEKEFTELLEYSKFHNKINIAKERLRIDRDLLEEIITNVADAIVEDIRFMIKKARQNISNFILVGGFSNSEVVRDKIKKHFPSVNLLYPPTDVELSVVKGAVLYGLNPSYIKSS